MSYTITNIPNNWEVKKMPQVVKWGSGGTPKATEKQYYEGGTIPWLVIGDLNDGIVYSSAKKITELGLQNSSAKMIPEGTLLVAMYGSIGKLGITGMECCTNQAIAYAKELYGVTTKYMYYYMMMLKSELISKGKGGTQKNISQTVLNSLDVIVPPISEQNILVERIEELLSQLNSGVDTLMMTRAKLELFRHSVIKDVFEKEIQKYPYKQYSLKEIVVDKEGLRRGPFGGSIKKSCFVPEGYKVYEQGNAINDTIDYGKYYISEEKYKEMASFHVLPHDLLVSCSGTLGRITEIPDDAPAGIINQALLRIRLNKDIVNADYFIHYFRSGMFQQMIFDKSQGSAMDNLVGIKEFKEIKMNIPERQYQPMLVGIVSEKLSVCESIENTINSSLAQADAMRQSILKMAFEGRL